MSKLSQRLQEYMQEKNLSQSDLAKETGINRSNISEFLSEKHTPSYAYFTALLYYFNCSADYLLGIADTHRGTTAYSSAFFGKITSHAFRTKNLANATCQRIARLLFCFI